MITWEEAETMLKKIEAKLLMEGKQARNFMNVTIQVVGSEILYYKAVSMARININEDALINRDEAVGRVLDALTERYFS